MAFDLDYFLKINNSYGVKSKKDSQLYDIKNHVNDRFTDTIDCYRVKINDFEKELLIIRTTKQDEKTIKSRPDEDFNIGDYVVFEGNTWLVISKDVCNQVYTTGTMKLTNYTIKFQHPKTGAILSYPCIDSTYNTAGIDEDKVITTGNAIHTIKLPFDANTVLIDTDDRFIIDDPSVKIPQVFAVSKPNRTEFKHGDKGLIELTMKQDKFQDVDGKKPKDRQDLGVCNYFEPGATTTPPENKSYAKLSVNGSLILGGKSRTITSIFYDSDGVVNNDVIAVWNVELPNGYEKYFTITYGNNTCMIQASDDDYGLLRHSPILVSVSDVNGNYEGSIEINIESGW